MEDKERNCGERADKVSSREKSRSLEHDPGSKDEVMRNEEGVTSTPPCAPFPLDSSHMVIEGASAAMDGEGVGVGGLVDEPHRINSPNMVIERVRKSIRGLVFSDNVRTNKVRSQLMDHLWALERITSELVLVNTRLKGEVEVARLRRVIAEGERDRALEEARTGVMPQFPPNGKGDKLNINGANFINKDPPPVTTTRLDNNTNNTNTNTTDSTNINKNNNTLNYARGLKEGKARKPVYKPDQTLAVIIETAEDKTLDETRKAFVALSRKSGSLKICNLKENKSKKCLIAEVGTEAERAKVEDLVKGHLASSRPKGLMPSITVFNIPVDVSDADVVECISTKNYLGENDLDSIKVSRTFKNPRGNTDRVVLMNPKLHSQLMRQEDKRLFLLYSRHSYRNRVPWVRCYKCHGYGHTNSGDKCTAKSACARCASEDPQHKAENCQAPPRCINCSRAGHRASDHPVTDSLCPRWLRHLAITEARVRTT